MNALIAHSKHNQHIFLEATEILSGGPLRLHHSSPQSVLSQDVANTCAQVFSLSTRVVATFEVPLGVQM